MYKCPICGSDSIIESHPDAHTETGVCRSCWHKADLDEFIDGREYSFSFEEERSGEWKG